MVRHTELLRSAVVGELFPILHDAERLIADPVVRNRGTVGGSVCQADPSEDLSAALAALRAEVVIEGPGVESGAGRRSSPSGSSTRVPTRPASATPRSSSRSGCRSGRGRAARTPRSNAGSATGRWPGSVSPCGWTATTVTEVGIGLTAVGAEHFVAAEAEEFLRGGPATVEAFTEAGRIAAEHSNPTADQRGPVDYKRHLVGELVVRALRTASDRALRTASDRLTGPQKEG